MNEGGAVEVNWREHGPPAKRSCLEESPPLQQGFEARLARDPLLHTGVKSSERETFPGKDWVQVGALFNSGGCELGLKASTFVGCNCGKVRVRHLPAVPVFVSSFPPAGVCSL